MDPPHINFINNKSILVISSNGKLRQLFVPFLVQVVVPTNDLYKGSWMVVEEVLPHPRYKLIFRITEKWYAYSCFKITSW